MRTPRSVHIAILVFPSCVPSAATGPADVFNVANTVARLRPAAEQIHFTSSWVSVEGGTVQVEGGIAFATSALADTPCDALLIPGIDHQTPSQLVRALERLTLEKQAVNAFAARGSLMAATCSGTYLLGEAGLLDGQRCTTSWWLGAHFEQRYPQATLQGDQILVADGTLLTAGGITSYLDLALWLIGHFGGDALRQIISKLLLADSKRLSQTPYVMAALVENRGHAVVERARAWLNRHLDKAWTMDELAEHCNTSARTLLRRFRAGVGMTPVQYAQQLRVERAKSFLESTTMSLDTITARCGYEDVSTFSKVFKRWTHITPGEYRRKFGLRA